VTNKKSKILVYVRLYPPTTNAGAELMLHEIVLELKNRGHEIMIAMPLPPAPEIDGIKTIPYSEVRHSGFVPDVIFTQNHDTKKAMLIAQNMGKPLVHFVHNDKAASLFRISSRNSDLVVSNSEWVSNSMRLPGVQKIVINPTTDFKKYKTDRSKANKITFINLIEIKGVDIFWQIARIMQDREFLAVIGGYGDQVIFERPLPNVKILDNTEDMKSIYSQTRILLVPSNYESWGRVGIEAMSSGIPVIASRTKGLEESLGDAGIFCDQDVASYIEAIRELDSKTMYREYSEKSVKRAEEISQRFSGQVDQLENFILKSVG
jgi:glycosyltransferase involved in cell wall biosynthesis